MCVSVLPVCMYMCDQVPSEARRWHRIPSNWSYRGLWAACRGRELSPHALHEEQVFLTTGAPPLSVQGIEPWVLHTISTLFLLLLWGFHTMNFGYIHPSPSPSQTDLHPAPCPLNLVTPSPFFTYQIQFVLPIYSWLCNLPVDPGRPTSGNVLKENWFPFS